MVRERSACRVRLRRAADPTLRIARSAVNPKVCSRLVGSRYIGFLDHPSELESSDHHGAHRSRRLYREGTTLCYRTICGEGEQFLGQHGHPEMSLARLHFSSTSTALPRRLSRQGVPQLMLDSAQKLASAGTELARLPDDTIHQVLRWYAPITATVPHIARWSAERQLAIATNASRYATGTRSLVESNVYPEKLTEREVDSAARPAGAPRGSSIASSSTTGARAIPASVARLLRPGDHTPCERMICDAVILGCTEFPSSRARGFASPIARFPTRLLAAPL